MKEAKSIYQVTWEWTGPHEEGPGAPYPKHERTIIADNREQALQEFRAASVRKYLENGWIANIRIRRVGITQGEESEER